ncbi:MAG: hypothetical protein V4713_13105 [Pseudomonadota bacterium]
MNTTTQQQMTTGRDALGLSLLASQLLATLKHTVAAIEQLARGLHRHHPEQANFCGYRWDNAHHIRGGNPGTLRRAP